MQIDLENIRIHYKLYNSPKNNADYLVLIHGLGLDLTIWEPLIPPLQDYYHILIFDMRGHGNTEGDTNAITWDVLVDDFNTLITKLAMDRFHIAGYGFGGNLAIKINDTYPEKVKKIILTSVYMYFPENSTKKELDKRIQLISHGEMSELSTNMIHQICYNLTPEKELLLSKAYSNVDQGTYFTMLRMLSDTVSLEDLTHIDKEVLLIQGDQDPLFPIQLTNLYQSYLKNSISYIVPNASNLVPFDSPCSFITLVGHFIKEGISSSFTSIMQQEFTQNVEKLFTKSFNTLGIKIINGFSISYQGREIEAKWNQRKAKKLLAYLAYHNAATREELIDEFWGESDLDSGKNNLRVALNHLKSILTNHNLDSYLQIGRENISLVGDVFFDLSNYMQLLNVCAAEPDRIRKQTLYRELKSVYNEKMFLDLYDNWLFAIHHQIETQLNEIFRSMS